MRGSRAGRVRGELTWNSLSSKNVLQPWQSFIAILGMQKVQASPLLNLWNAREPGCGGAMAVADAMRRATAEMMSFIFVVMGLDGGFYMVVVKAIG